MVVIDDDREDLEMIGLASGELQPPNELLLFDNSANALGYLQRVTQAPALIICDVNMPCINGFEFRSNLLELVPSFEKIPFFFLSTSTTPEGLRSAESLRAQGYFEKSRTFDGLRDTIQAILLAVGILA